MARQKTTVCTCSVHLHFSLHSDRGERVILHENDGEKKVTLFVCWEDDLIGSVKEERE